MKIGDCPDFVEDFRWNRRKLKIKTIFALSFFILIFAFSIFPAHADITTGLVGHWKFDEGSGTTATDSSGSGNIGTLTNGPTWTTGKIGQALSFDGVNDYVDATNTSSLSITSAGTVSAWVKSRCPSANYCVIASKGNLDTTRNGYLFIIRSSSLFWLELDSSSASQVVTSNSTIPPNTGAWVHLVGTWDGSTVKLYLNGVADIAPVSQTVTPVSNVSNFRVGKDSSFSTYNFSGDIDDVRIYSRALSAGEVQKLYNLGR